MSEEPLELGEPDKIGKNIFVVNLKVKALNARLEAAEECKNALAVLLELVPRDYVTEIKQAERAIKAWRKSKGE